VTKNGCRPGELVFFRERFCLDYLLLVGLAFSHSLVVLQVGERPLGILAVINDSRGSNLDLLSRHRTPDYWKRWRHLLGVAKLKHFLRLGINTIIHRTT